MNRDVFMKHFNSVLGLYLCAKARVLTSNDDSGSVQCGRRVAPVRLHLLRYLDHHADHHRSHDEDEKYSQQLAHLNATKHE